MRLGYRELREVFEEAPRVVPIVEVEGQAGGISRFSFDDDGLRSAYEMALHGPKPKEQPPGDPDKYGDDLPR